MSNEMDEIRLIAMTFGKLNLEIQKIQKMIVVYLGHKTTFTYCLINYIQPCCYCKESYPFIINVIK